jgi:putative ABC transport system permease protein
MLYDLRVALRTLAKRPGFTFVAVATLAIGIGAVTAVFSLAEQVLLRPLPYADPERLVILFDVQPSLDRAPMSYPEMLDWRGQDRLFSAVGSYFGVRLNLTGEGDPERVMAARVSSSLLPTLGLSPALGRGLRPEEEVSGGPKVALVTDGAWRRRFAADPGVLGRTVTLDGEPYTVIGVLPPAATLDDPEPDFWLPLGLDEAGSPRGLHYLSVLGRLRPGIELGAARTEAAAIAERLGEAAETDHRIRLAPLGDEVVAEARPLVALLAAAVGCVLLIACVNVANLLLVRGAERQREFAIRRALGAERLRLLRQTLTESLLLVFIGGGTGVLVASWLVKLIPALGAAKIPRVEHVEMDLRVVLFACVVSGLTAVVFGLVPAIQCWRNDIQSSLRESGRNSGATPARHRLRKALVISEVAIAVVLLAGAGLLFRSFVRLIQVDPGFSKENVLALQIFLARSYQEPAKIVGFFEQSLEKIKGLPGIEAAAVVTSPPFINLDSDATFIVVGRPAPPPGSEPSAFYIPVSSEYLNALGIPLKRGRFFTEFDGPGSPPVVVINETMARRHFQNEDAIGRRLTVNFGEPETREVVGVIGDVLHSGLHQEPSAQMFVPHQQSASSHMTFVMKTTNDPAAQVASVKRAIREVNPNQTFAKTATMEELVSDSLKQRRFNLFLLGIFAAMALLLATIGIYGSISYSTRQRTNEIGVRIALGAQSLDVLRLIVGQGVALALIGVAIGLGAAFLLTRAIKSLLFGVSPTDPLTFVAISLLLLVTALVASLIPARRATKVDPLIALRTE